MKQTRIKGLTPEKAEYLALSIWLHLSDVQKDLLLLYFEHEPDRTHIDLGPIAQLYSFLWGAMRHKKEAKMVLNALSHFAFDRIGRPHITRPGFMLY